jgi:hypothetical protein
MSTPAFTAEYALYRSRHVYREYDATAGARYLEEGGQPASMPATSSKKVCAVSENGVTNTNCPVKNVPCNPPDCYEGYTCCYDRSIITSDTTYNYYACVDLKTNASNCGACGNYCDDNKICCNGACVDPTDESYDCETCGCINGGVCQNGTCQCTNGQTYCKDICTYIDTDANNCGTCGNVCPPGQCCVGGQCVQKNLKTDPNNCGSCGTVCYSYGCCDDGKCANVLSDDKNCGTCGNSCAAGQSCCQGVCADYQNDFYNCGGCGVQCGAGLTCCHGNCVGLGEPEHCGSCDNVCKNKCCYNGSCADFSNDPNNCGSCGNLCEPSFNCYNGCCVNGTPGLTSAIGAISTNYWLVNQNTCENISDLAVGLYVQSNLSTSNGFSLQLNAVPPPNSVISWMQYTFIVSGSSVTGNVEYWGFSNQGTPVSCMAFSNQNLNVNCCSYGNCCNGWESFWDPIFGGACQTGIPFLSLPSNTIPAGYELLISLNSDPSSGNVTAATFWVFDQNGDLTYITVDIPGNLQVPVQAFQYVAVGKNGRANTTFTSGSGTISYTVAEGQELCVAGASVPCASANVYSGFTGETSNASYGNMNHCCGNDLKQSLLT